jgi:hypothetical protein
LDLSHIPSLLCGPLSLVKKRPAATNRVPLRKGGRMEERKKLTIPDLLDMVTRGEKIAFLTATITPQLFLRIGREWT